MKIVVDESVSLAVALRLRAKGHDVIAIAERATAGMPDPQVFALARQENAVLITRDYGFTRSVRYPPAALPGILFIREGNLRSEDEVEIVERFLRDHEPAEFSGALVTLYRSSVRIRR